MTKLSPLSSIILNEGKITFVCKVIINSFEFTHENGLMSASLRKETAIDGKISATDFTLVLTDMPSKSIFYNPVYPTYPSIHSPGAKVEVLMGYARYSGSGDRTDLSNQFIQWFKVMTGNTSTYNYNAKNRTLSIGCYDKVEEMINKGDWNSPSFEYMTVPEILNVIANNPKMPPQLEANQIHNPIFSMYSENTRFPAFWSGDILKVGGFTRYGRNKLPNGWYPNNIPSLKNIIVSQKEYTNLNKLNNLVKFNERNNLLYNYSLWSDTNSDGLADWWNQSNLTFYKTNDNKYLGYRSQIISGLTDSRFYQIIDEKKVNNNNIIISGNIKALNGSYAFFVNDGIAIQTGSFYSNTSFADMSESFTITSNPDFIHVGIIPSGLIEFKELNSSDYESFYSPYGYKNNASGSINNKTGPTLYSKNNDNSGSFRFCASGTKFSSDEFGTKMLVSGETPIGSLTFDIIYNTSWQVPASGLINRITGINNIDNIELSYDTEISGTNGKWLYESININNEQFSISSGNYITYSGFINRFRNDIIINDNESLSPVFISNIRVFENELLGNPCFKDSNSDGIPDGYSYIKNNNTIIRIDTSNYVEMNQSINITNSDYDNGSIKKTLSNIDKTSYSLVGNYLAENIECLYNFNSGVYVDITAYNSDEEFLWNISSPHISGFTNWNKFVLNFDVSLDVSEIDVSMGIKNAKGKALFNDVRLFKNSNLNTQGENKEFQIKFLKNEEIYSNIKDVDNLMHTGSSVCGLKTIKMNSKVDQKYNKGVNTISDTFFENGIGSIITGSNISLSIDERNESILGDNNLVITFE